MHFKMHNMKNMQWKSICKICQIICETICKICKLICKICKICNSNHYAESAKNMQNNTQNMQAICRFSWYCSILHAICKICKILCTICKICKRHFQYAEYAPPTLLMCRKPLRTHVRVGPRSPRRRVLVVALSVATPCSLSHDDRRQQPQPSTQAPSADSAINSAE